MSVYICVVVQSPSCVWLCNSMDCRCQASLSLTISQSLQSSCPLHRWCHPAISDTLFPFSPQSFPAPGTFPVSQLFASNDQNTEVLASASVLPMSIQGWFPLRLPGLISLLSKGLSSLLQHHSSKASVLRHTAFLQSSFHSHMWPLGRP